MMAFFLDVSVETLLAQLVDNPLNWILLALNLWMVKEILTPPPPMPEPKHREAIVLRGFTLQELRHYNGATTKDPVYLAVRGKVYDVSRGRNFYGPGGPYANFAGRDASRGLAKNSFETSMLSDEYDPLEDLTDSERESLREWQMTFEAKYDHVGWIDLNR